MYSIFFLIIFFTVVKIATVPLTIIKIYNVVDVAVLLIQVILTTSSKFTLSLM